MRPPSVRLLIAVTACAMLFGIANAQSRSLLFLPMLAAPGSPTAETTATTATTDTTAATATTATTATTETTAATATTATTETTETTATTETTETTAEPSATPTLPPPDFVSCSVVGDPSRAPNYPVKITAIDKQAETVTLRNVSEAAIDLAGWRMCSVTGGQQHPISGTLAPGEQHTFPGPAGPIWNNTNSDPGALWNPAGQLVSYRGD